MIGTYASAALICAASLLVGRATMSVAGRRSWSWLEPAVGLAAVLTVTGVLARAPGHGTSATLGLVALLIAAAAIAWRAPYEAKGALREGWPVAVVVLLALSIPFAISGRWGLLGVGFNNDLGLHLAWAEWLRSGFGPTPEAGYPLGPHGLAVAVAAVPGIGLGKAFTGEIVAIGVLTGLTALGALRELAAGRRVLATSLVALCYLAASYYAQAAFKETAEALFVLAFAIYLTTISKKQTKGPGSPGSRSPSPDTQQRAPRAVSGVGDLLPGLTLAGGIFFSYSFAGLAWPIAILGLWSLTLPEVRRMLRPGAVLRFLLRPLTLLTLLLLGGLAVVVTVVGPFGFASTFNKVAGSNTYGPVSPLETLGVWPAGNYRLDAAGGARLPGLAGAIGALALLAGVAWWVRRRELTIPVALGACAVLYLASLPFSGDYSQAKALMIAAPLAMLVAIRPLMSEFPFFHQARGRPLATYGGRRSTTRLAWAVLAVAFVGGAVYSSFLALRDAPVGPPGHGAELQAFLPVVQGKSVLYAGQDRYAAYELQGADTHVPLVEFPDPEVEANPEKPFDTGDAYSPIDFDSFSRGTLDRFPFVITGRAAWNSQAPRNFRRVMATPSYVLWKRTGPTPEDRHVLLEGTEAAAHASCAAPEVRILLANPGRASLFPDAVTGPKAAWREESVLGAGESASQTLSLPRGSWNLSLQYFSPFDLILSAPGFSEPLAAALDGQRPNTISLGNNGQFWPAGRFESDGGQVRFEISAADAGTLQDLSGYDGKAYVGGLVAVPAGPHRIVPLIAACGGWLDWYESSAVP
jgi:Ca2+/Na+ antiporter